MTIPSDAAFIILTPDINNPDVAIINALRQKHDSLYAKIPPHITLVFPQSIYSAEWLANIALQDFAEETTIECVFDTLSVVHEADASYLFLLSSDQQALATIAAWHKKLYAHESLAATFKASTPFKAHITVGRFENAADADKAYAENKSSFQPVKIKLNTLCTVHRHQGQRIITHQLRLKEA